MNFVFTIQMVARLGMCGMLEGDSIDALPLKSIGELSSIIGQADKKQP